MGYIMNLQNRVFGGINMTWKKVIIFALITGVYTGLINLVPFLYETSFRDIAVNIEWWVLFGVIIASNCKKPLESGLKIFVFFLISQPMVYLVEMPFLGVGIWSYYKYWAFVTVLTLPGGMIANLIKKKNLLGTLVLSVALSLVAAMAELYLEKVYVSFPHHILTVIFCILQIIVLIANLVPKKKLKVLAASIAIIVFFVAGAINLSTQNITSNLLPEGEGWTCYLQDESNGTASCDDNHITYKYNKILVKSNTIICTNENGDSVKYDVIVSDDHNVSLVLQNDKI